jgi:2-dehydro-3-deoxyphosphogluconate aldolase/(4S)-4-hydroxy-2-oxoglutarate aldolase
MTYRIDSLMGLAPVIPVLVVDDAALARPLAEALVAGGLPVLEVTLRTPAALDVIREMRKVAGAIVGAGTVLDPNQLDAALGAGAEFIVSPGLTEDLAAAARGTAFLPGIATASDLMRGLAAGLDRFKFFPAAAAGGIPALKALSAPFAAVQFCPTGGITPESAPEWLALPSVRCVGGSWLVPAGEAFDAAAIESRARQAAALSAAARPRP